MTRDEEQIVVEIRQYSIVHAIDFKAVVEQRDEARRQKDVKEARVKVLENRMNAIQAQIVEQRQGAAMNPEIEHIEPVYRILDAIMHVGVM